MFKKNKFKMIFYTIITFGLIWIKWKKQLKHTKNTIYQSNNLPFDINLLKVALGEGNIEKVETKPSRITVFLKNAKIADLDKIRKLKGVTGIFAKSDSVSIILGEFSAITARLLEGK
ncbi:hypothetical protein VO56_01250 [Mycoplasmopsis gallinacea]|uniref:Uncharacterized protein n=1 Tax=Mycoplasmopsis gallinacea TaxID=29556 RepID=A0A0D5ZJL9_9BACT|nr:hypothetical protein VO56_01250 [Mycoplasmopsis gallinacea]